MSEMAPPRIFTGGVDSSVREISLRVSDDIPRNEHGIVTFPNPHWCIGPDCIHRRNDEEQCFIDRDHLHHSAAYYDFKGQLALEFRDEEALMRWVFRCVHDQKHEEYPFNVPLPDLRVMKGAIQEARLLREIEANYRSRVSLARVAAQADQPRWSRRAAQKSLEIHVKKKKEMVRSVENIEFLPQEIVTGALLLASPGHAENRLIADPRYALPGTIRRDDVFTAWQAAEDMLVRRQAKIDAMFAGRQLDEEFLQAVERAA